MENEFILICSDVYEPTTDIVCSWLYHYKKKFLRISSEDIISIKKIEISEFSQEILFTINKKDYKLSQFKSYWYRRSYLKFESPDVYIQKRFKGKIIEKQLNEFLKNEYFKIIEYFKLKINSLALLNKESDNNINKLEVLYLAHKIGISIPDTYIINNLSALNFLNKSFITKAISDVIIRDDKKSFSSLTKRIRNKDKDKGEEFFYSLVQNEIEKKFEIRSFFFNNTFYSSAIFSQVNTKTKLDFRNYDFENPNRVVPFTLPKEIEIKLLKIAKYLSLKSGSFDLAYSIEGKYILFEVNPIGQFEQVSFPCNYNLHKLIAKFL